MDIPRGLQVAHNWLGQILATGRILDDTTVERITSHCFRNRPCRDCGAAIGEPHDGGCDVARCLYTGYQRIQCGGYDEPMILHQCVPGIEPDYDADGYIVHTCGIALHDCGAEVWDGVWPGTQEAVEYGWFSYFAPTTEQKEALAAFGLEPVKSGWVRCGPEYSEAMPDLNRVVMECDWDREQRRWVKR